MAIRGIILGTLILAIVSALSPAEADRAKEGGAPHPLLDLRAYEGWVAAVAFSPDGKLIASGSEDGTLRGWDVQKGRQLLCLSDHPDNVTSVAFSPDGKRIASASKATLKVWACPAARDR